MNPCKKGYRIAAFVLASVLLFVGVLFLFFKPLLYRLYPFDRITGTVCVSIDGEKNELKRSDVAVRYDNSEIDVGFREDFDGARISVQGGEYGPYTLIINIDGLNSPIEAVIYQYNWWNVSKFNLDISIDNANESITLTSSSNSLNENGKSVRENHSSKSAFSEKHIITIVSV